MSDFEVRKDDLRQTRFTSGEPRRDEVADGDAQLEIVKFGFTANNVTYGAIGDMVGYWRFFPASDTAYGRIPAWGYGDVVASRSAGVEPGQRFYGYFPMSTYLTVRPQSGGPGFIDVTPHRTELPAVYNRYVRVDPGQPHEDAVMILRPLFSTGWLIAEYLKNAGRVIVSSASSKTAYSTTFVLTEKGIPTTGLTSPRNRDYTTSLDLYDEIITYDEIATRLSGSGVYVDFAGNRDVSRAVHEGAKLTKSIQVGLTHWDHPRAGDGLPDPQPEFFFAPAHIERLSKELGPGRLQESIRESLSRLAQRLDRFMEIEASDDVEGVFRAFVDGAVDPRKGYVLRVA
ncbi:MAG: DUF2855 family protein [Thermoleophilaceae bacterium]|nr:DUF2855 family protein [Thermoleophilaceae bacterium]